jgi:hypothetical protein
MVRPRNVTAPGKEPRWPGLPRASWRGAAELLAWTTVVAIVFVALAPWFRDLRTLGFHDWDVQTAHRYLTVLSLRRYHELPGWNPYACGGFPAWGYVEADTILVSPWLPFYLTLPMSIALRVEVVGMALIGSAGAYVLAGRFTESFAARALVAALWAVNGRFGLQIAAGHTWHLAYAWTPWCLYAFEVARRPPWRALPLAGAGAAIAMLVYAGGIYPLPHTALALGLYAAGLAVAERSARPLAALAACGAAGIGLAAPKLLPLLVAFGKAPRLIDSTESFELGAFVTALVSRDQGFFSRPARVPAYGWHEWGMYVGAAGLAALLLGLVFVEGRRERALKLAGGAFLVLGFGAFHPEAPWTLLHKLPVFRSQHVPSRFHYVAMLLCALVAAAGLGRWLVRRARSMPWLDALAAALVLAIGVDVASVAQKPLASAMTMLAPDIAPRPAFRVERDPPWNYKNAGAAWVGGLEYLAMLGNTGVLNCYSAPPFDKGAKAANEANYPGDARVEGGGSAKVAAWSPNHVELEVDSTKDGALVTYNQNRDEGWHARVVRDGAGSASVPVVLTEAALAARVPAGHSRLVFSYRPPRVLAGLALATLTAGLLALAWDRERRRERGLAPWQPPWARRATPAPARDDEAAE